MRASASRESFSEDGRADLRLPEYPAQARFLTRRAVSDYHINILFSEEDGGYIADIPDLDSCSAFGKTPEEALAQVELAKGAWLAAAREAGKPVPPPPYRLAIYPLTR